MTENLFDNIAKKYDSEKQIHLAKKIQDKVKSELQETSDKVLLDYGSGTGLVSLDLAGSVKELYLVDASKEMTEITSQKIKQQELRNAKALEANLLTTELPFKADIILISLVLLHVPETQNFLAKLKKQLNTGGKLLIVDFDLNEKITDKRVHNGFEKNYLKEVLESIGFTDVLSETFYEGEKLFMNQDASLCLTVARN